MPSQHPEKLATQQSQQSISQISLEKEKTLVEQIFVKPDFGYKLDWKQPDIIDLTQHRAEYRNLYKYGMEFEKEYDLFGDDVITKATTLEEQKKLDYFKPQLVMRYIQKQINEICMSMI